MLAMGGSVTLYMKLYRNFTRYEVLAVDQTNSLLNPISIEIRYNYSLVGTALAQSEAEANDDLAYSAIDEFHIRRVYACDKDGRLAEDLPPLPPRAEYWPHKSKLAAPDRDMTGQTAVTDTIPMSPFGGGGVMPGGPSFPGGDLPVMPKTPPPGAIDY
jgi:hypothetical protein